MMKIICANWKFNKELRQKKEALAYLKKLEEKIAIIKNVEVKIFPHFLVLKELVQKAKKVKIGAQDIHWEEDGSFTGATLSAHDLLSLGVRETLIGHSETRFYFGVNEERMFFKIKSALENNIFPTICLGETIEEKENGKTAEILEKQIENSIFQILEKLKPPQNSFAVAYEPIYAISGFAKILGKEPKPAELEDIRFAHEKIKEIFLRKGYKTQVLYGGSCSPENAKKLLSQKFIDGLLIGSASFELNSFFDIIKITQNLNES